MNVAEPTRGSQEPRLSEVPDFISSAGEEAIEIATLAGLHLDPWEQAVLIGGCGERADGKWAAFEVGLEAPRQNGKGSILEARELAGLFSFGERLLIHSAHEQATSSEHFRRLLQLIESVPDFDRRVMRAPKGKGAEAIELRGGQRILFKTRTGGGGRGLTGDFVALDEAMILPEAMIAALVPTMAARSIHGNPQLWYAGSAVDRQKHEHGVVFARVRERGLRAAPRVAWFEWSAEGDDPDMVPDEVRENPAVWAQANPGMGIRISAEHIANECGGALGPREFAVERLGIGDWPPTDGTADQVISDEAWAACMDASSSDGPRALAFDVRPDRSSSAIGAGDSRRFVKVLDHRPGTGWLVDRLVELANRHGVPVFVDEKGPASSFIDALAKKDVALVKINGAEYAAACGSFFDAVAQQTMSHEGSPELNAAVKGVAKRPLGDAWAWSRKSSEVDIGPLVAVTLALLGVERELESVYEDQGLLIA